MNMDASMSMGMPQATWSVQGHPSNQHFQMPQAGMQSGSKENDDMKAMKLSVRELEHLLGATHLKLKLDRVELTALVVVWDDEKSAREQALAKKEELAQTILTDAQTTLQNKLDRSYAELRELATKTVESASGVKIIGSSGE